jgi:PAS domain-containing protein
MNPLLAALALLALALPAAAQTSPAPEPAPAWWTALALGGVIVLAYGVTHVVSRPFLRQDDIDPAEAALARTEATALRAVAEDLACGVAAVDGEGRILFANRVLRDRGTPLPGKRLAEACGNPALDDVLRRVADLGTCDTELRLAWGVSRLRGLRGGDGAVVLFRDRALPTGEAPASSASDTVSTRGHVSIDLVGRRISVEDEVLDLTETEFRLLAFLLENPGQVFSRADLLRDVWGHREPVYSRTVDTHVQRLRDKLGAHRERLETVRGAGYRWRAG